MYSLHYLLQSRSVQKKQCFNVLLKWSVMKVQINLLIYNIFMSYKLLFKKDLLSSLLKAYVALSFICNFIQLKI